MNMHKVSNRLPLHQKEIRKSSRRKHRPQSSPDLAIEVPVSKVVVEVLLQWFSIEIWRSSGGGGVGLTGVIFAFVAGIWFRFGGTMWCVGYGRIGVAERRRKQWWWGSKPWRFRCGGYGDRICTPIFLL